jgi:hypothetical protein
MQRTLKFVERPKERGKEGEVFGERGGSHYPELSCGLWLQADA